MNQIRILLKILLLQATAIIQVIRLSNYGNFRTVGALSSPGLPTSLRKIKCVCPRKNVIFLWFSTGDFSFFRGGVQSIVRKTRDRISVHYLSPEWRSLDGIAKFASTILTTGAQYANSLSYLRMLMILT
jgi:hypothetical protein